MMKKIEEKEVDELVTGKEAARQLGVHFETVRRWRREGKLTAIKFNSRCVRYRRSQIDGLIRASEVNV